MNRHNSLSRKEFIQRFVKTGASLSLTAGAAAYLFDPVGPKETVKESSLVVPDFQKAYKPGQTMSIVQGRDRTQGVTKAVDLLGGMERFVKPGSRVLIKPNVAFASAPDLGATTHPDMITALVKMCYQAKAKQVYVTDNPINDPASCFLLSGIEQAALEAGAKIIYPKENLMEPISLKGGRLIQNWPFLYHAVKNMDTLIGVAPLKIHHRSGASMTMKNWYGLLGGRRNIFHQDIHTIITELAMLIKPSLVVLDGVDIMVANGPTGGSVSDLKPGNTIIASCDQLAADSYGASLLGKKIADLPFLSQAEQAKVGVTDYASLKPIIANLG